jgi:putative ABC transport system permease protein
MRPAEPKIPFFLLWRFVRRSNRASLSLTVFLMAIAFINLVFIASLFNGIVVGTNEQFINAYVGNVTVAPQEGKPLLEHVDDTLEAVRATPGVAGVSAQTSMLGTLKWQDTTITRQVVALDPKAEAGVTNIARKIIEGSYLKPDDVNGILLGVQIAGGSDNEQAANAFKHAHAGDAVTVTVNNVKKQFTVRGVFATKLIIGDERAIITQSALEHLMPFAKDKATGIIIRADRAGIEQEIIQALKERGVAGKFGTWEESATIMKSVTKSFRSINVLISIVGLLIAAVTIFIVIYIDIVNRGRQIGILRAIGIKAWIIRATYVLQSGLYALAGVLLGSAIFFFALVPWFHRHPFQLPICDAVLLTNALDYLARAVTVVVVAVLSGLIPAIRATRMNLLDAVLGR